jgi:Protein of unknown function (DUF1018)
MKINQLIKQPNNRNNLMAMIHIAAANLDIKSHSEEYRDWLESVSGSRSCKNLADDQLAAVVARLKQKGLLLNKPTGSAPNRPTNAQWAKVEILAKQLPLESVKTPHFAAWVKKVTKLESPRFLTKTTMRDVIAGLERWLAYEKRKLAKPATSITTTNQ